MTTRFLNEKEFISVDLINDFKYYKFDAEAAGKYYEYFAIRPNKSYDSVPLDSLIWSDTVETQYCLLDNKCLLLKDKGDGETPSGCLPFCTESELPYYFKLQEKYFNQVLNVPFSAYYADSEGVEYLKSLGVLDNYDIKEEEDIFDYIYSGDALRTLSGRTLSKKRNCINKFIKKYDGRWEYKTLGYDDQYEIRDILDKWYKNKSTDGLGIDLGKNYDTDETLKIEHTGILKIFESKALLDKIKMGGIYVDNGLAALSIASLNSSEQMAVLEIEKALPGYEGLYQLIKREFLSHEFPAAKIVNMEDDLGIEGLRRSKMSYKPCMFEKRYTIIQNDFK